MNSSILTLLVPLFLQSTPAGAQQAPPAKGSIEGVVVRIGTGEPIPAARVTLTRSIGGQTTLLPGGPLPPPNFPVGAAVVTSSSGSLSTLSPSIPSVTTDRQGRFSLKDVDAGSYRLTVAANGYARQEFGQRVFGAPGTPINVAAGQTVKDLSIRMTPAGNVNGRISDDLGLPAVGATVQLLRASYNLNGQKTFQSAGSTRTNDRGEYRLFWVTPGRYYLYAGSPPGPTRPLELGGAGDSPNGVQESYAMTYYSGAIDIKDATIIDVQPAVDLNAIDFSLPRQKLFRIRGRVIDARTGQRPAAATMTLGSRSLTGGGFTSSTGQSYNAADGSFELRDVAPGTYTVGAQIQEGVQGTLPPIFAAGAPPRPTGSVPVTVSGSDVDGVVITITVGVSIPGRINVEGQDLSSVTGLDRIRVQLSSSSAQLGPAFQPMPQAQPVNADGTFREDSAFPGEYRASVVPLPPGFYVKEIRFDQADALNKPLVFSGSISSPLEVILSPRAAQLDGTVTSEKQQTVPGIQVVLIPDQHRDRTDLYKTAVTDQNGRFTIRGIAPGDYKIFAWEVLEQFSYFDPDVILRFESRGKVIHLSESDKASVEMKVIPAEGQ
jgi:Carboxypeptidase regulatory-like domain